MVQQVTGYNPEASTAQNVMSVGQKVQSLNSSSQGSAPAAPQGPMYRQDPAAYFQPRKYTNVNLYDYI